MAIVTLTTDFGTADGYVGAMKGVILSLAPDAVMVDIAHDVPRHDVAAAAYALKQAAPLFPDGTIHVAVVDPGVGTDRAAVIVDDGRQLYVGPDNGIFALVAPTPRAAYSIVSPGFRRDEVSATFHGRDVFAAAAGRLAAGASPSQAGPVVPLRGGLRVPRARAASEGEVVATIIHVDGFGNLITDLPAEKVPPGAQFGAGTTAIERLSTTFEDVLPAEPLAFIGSAGTLEIAVREGSAAQRLGLGRGDSVVVTVDIDDDAVAQAVIPATSQPIELSIDSLAAGGAGVARDSAGRVTFVPHTAPGDRVRVRVTQERRGFARGELVAVASPSQRRVEPRCPLFIARTCGGCAWQHIEHGAQADGKSAIVASALRRPIDAGMKFLPILTPVSPYGWRRRARVHWYRGRRATSAIIGFFAPGSHRVTQVDDCPQLEPALMDAIRALGGPLSETLGRRGEISLLCGHAGDVHVVIHGHADGDAAAALVGQAGIAGVTLGTRDFGAEHIELEPGLPGRADWFAQSSLAGNRALLDVVDQATRPRDGLRILELYAGSGNLTRILAEDSAAVIAVDTRKPPWPVHAALRFRQGAAAAVVRQFATARARFDAVVLDPPRTGAAELMGPLIALNPVQIVYVSCDPATLARDVATLMDASYRPLWAQPLDLMPQTAHVEVVVCLVREGARLGATDSAEPEAPAEPATSGGDLDDSDIDGSDIDDDPTDPDLPAAPDPDTDA